MFVENFVPTKSANVGDLLHAVDHKAQQLPISHHNTTNTENREQKLVVIHELDNSALQEHRDLDLLSKQVKGLQEENVMLKAEIQELKSSPTSTHTNQTSPRTYGQSKELSIQKSPETDAIAHTINLLPKTLETFYKQMTEGDEHLCKFEDIPEDYKRNPKTKAAYCKRRKVLSFILTYPEGIQECLSKYGKLSTTQVYDTMVKSTRTNK